MKWARKSLFEICVFEMFVRNACVRNLCIRNVCVRNVCSKNYFQVLGMLGLFVWNTRNTRNS
jgi:hypothetical protein